MSEDNIIPLYDEHKRRIYDDFQRLNRQQTEFISARSKYKKHFCLQHFKSKFCRFVNNVWSADSYNIVKKEVKDRIQYYRFDLSRIKSSQDIDEIIFLCIEVIKTLKITKITYTNGNDAF